MLRGPGGKVVTGGSGAVVVDAAVVGARVVRAAEDSGGAVVGVNVLDAGTVSGAAAAAGRPLAPEPVHAATAGTTSTASAANVRRATEPEATSGCSDVDRGRSDLERAKRNSNQSVTSCFAV